MRMHMACADGRISPVNLGIPRYACKRGRSILEEATHRPFDALHCYKVDYVGKCATAICA